MDFLNQIIDYKKAEVTAQKKALNLSFTDLQNLCSELPTAKSFIEILKANRFKDKISLIAEVKKASPSKGLIRENFAPVQIALDYQESGANAISVLTDEKSFLGSIEYLEEIKKAVNLPILRKDFIIDPFQIFQTRIIGADIILLIVKALGTSKLKDFCMLSKELGLEVLIEVHDEEELNQALELNAQLIGINNRNLKTFEVSIENTLNLIKDREFPNSYIISESGIKTCTDVITLKNNGISGILVGETLMRQENIKEAVHNLLDNN